MTRARVSRSSRSPSRPAPMRPVRDARRCSVTDPTSTASATRSCRRRNRSSPPSSRSSGGTGSESPAGRVELRGQNEQITKCALERLVRRRRHVDAAGDRLEVVDRERPRIDVSVPADHVERVVVEDVRLVAVPDAHLDDESRPSRGGSPGRRADGCRGGNRARARAAARTRCGNGAGSRSGRGLEDEVPLLALRGEAIGRAARITT